MKRLLTLGQVAELLGVRSSAVDYLVRSRGIAAAHRAGVLRLFDERAVAKIRAELEQVAARRQARRGEAGDE